jgi:hypothetical protein
VGRDDDETFACCRSGEVRRIADGHARLLLAVGCAVRVQLAGVEVDRSHMSPVTIGDPALMPDLRHATLNFSPSTRSATALDPACASCRLPRYG